MDCRRSSNIPGPLQEELLLSVCWPCLYFQLLTFLFARFESFELKFSMPGVPVVQKNKMIQLFWSLAEGKHVLFCSHWKTLLTHPSLSPLSRCVMLWCLVLFPFIALCADLHVNNLAVGTGFQTDSNTGAPKPGVGTKPMDLEAELTGGNTDRHNWAYPAPH